MWVFAECLRVGEYARLWLYICVHMCMYEHVVQHILRLPDEQIEGVILMKSDVWFCFSTSLCDCTWRPPLVKRKSWGTESKCIRNLTKTKTLLRRSACFQTIQIFHRDFSLLYSSNSHIFTSAAELMWRYFLNKRLKNKQQAFVALQLTRLSASLLAEIPYFEKTQLGNIPSKH